MQKIKPCLWFDNQAEEAVNFYVKIFKDSKIKEIVRYNEESAKAAGRPEGSVLTIDFELRGQEFLALNGGPIFKFTEAVSFMVNCDSQEEIDYFWNSLSEGGEESQCGWLKDKYGLSWQVVPSMMSELMSGPSDKVEKVTGELMKMKKIVIEDLKKAGE